jgi:hypothetical protein
LPARALHSSSSGKARGLSVRERDQEANMDSEAKPLAVYTVIEKQDGKDIWLRVGSGFHNRDGSLSLLLDAMPINGRLQVREYRPRDQASARRNAEASA